MLEALDPGREARRDPEEAAELVLEFAESFEGEIAARLRALAVRA